MKSMLKVAFSTVIGYTALFTVSMKTLQKIVTMLLKSKEFLGVDNETFSVTILTPLRLSINMSARVRTLSHI